MSGYNGASEKPAKNIRPSGRRGVPEEEWLERLSGEYSRILSPMRGDANIIGRRDIFGRNFFENDEASEKSSPDNKPSESTCDAMAHVSTTNGRRKNETCAIASHHGETGSAPLSHVDETACASMAQVNKTGGGKMSQVVLRTCAVATRADVETCATGEQSDVETWDTMAHLDGSSPRLFRFGRGSVFDVSELGRRIDEHRKNGTLTPTFERFVLRLAVVAMKSEKLRVNIGTSKLASSVGASRRTGVRFVASAKLHFGDIFESADSVRGARTSFLFNRGLWYKTPEDRETDNNKELKSLFPKSMHKDDAGYLSLLFAVHVSGLSILPEFTKEKHSFFKNALRRTSAETEKKALSENERRKVVAEACLRTASEIVAMWRVVSSNTNSDISRPFRFFLSCWKKKGTDGTAEGSDIRERLSLAEFEAASRDVEMLFLVTGNDLDSPDLKSLTRAASLLGVDKRVARTRTELCGAILEKATPVASELFRAYEFLSRELFVPPVLSKIHSRPGHKEPGRI